MINQDSVKAFWDRRADLIGEIPFESIGNLEHDESLIQQKVELESRKVSRLLGSLSGKRVLDLGSGVGQWALRFAELGAERVVAVDYSERLTELAKAEAKRRGIETVHFLVSPAESFLTEEKFDVVFISGLLLYMTDSQVNKLFSAVRVMCKDGGTVLVRDATGLEGRYEIENKFSQSLGDYYSAIYRSRQEIVDVCAKFDLRLSVDEDMFHGITPLNKHKQTRLRIYKFTAGFSDDAHL